MSKPTAPTSSSLSCGCWDILTAKTWRTTAGMLLAYARINEWEGKFLRRIPLLQTPTAAQRHTLFKILLREHPQSIGNWGATPPLEKRTSLAHSSGA